MNYVGKPIEWKLTNRFGMEISKENLYIPHYRKNCEICGSRLICNFEERDAGGLHRRELEFLAEVTEHHQRCQEYR